MRERMFAAGSYASSRCWKGRSIIRCFYLSGSIIRCFYLSSSSKTSDRTDAPVGWVDRFSWFARFLRNEFCHCRVRSPVDYMGCFGFRPSTTTIGIPDPEIHRGITPRSFEHIFQECSVRENTKFLIRASYLEIYNENVRDLLGTTVGTALDLREDPDRGCMLTN